MAIEFEHMVPFMIRFLAAFFVTFVMSFGAAAQSLPGYQELYVNDYADILSDPAEQRIRDRLIELREETGIEFTLLTISSMGDYGHSGSIEPFATQVFNAWGIGDAARNDGILMLIALNDRTMRIEVGSGYGSAMNAPMQEVIDDIILPSFRRDAMEDGIEFGVNNVIHEVAGVWPGEFDASAPERFAGSVSRGVKSLGGWIWVIFAPVAAFVAFLFKRMVRRRPRICPKDGAWMTRLNEANDDSYLVEGQRLEEQIGSVDYDVWVCSRCDHHTVEGHRNWFKLSHGVCRKCGYRTMEGDTTVLSQATRHSTGRKRIDYRCGNCGEAYSETRIIPKISNSSSSGGGSSFGGGSSSGGGASGSW